MTSIKLLGAAHERRALLRHLAGISWEEGQSDEIEHRPDSEDVWIVCRDSALAFDAALSKRRRKFPASNVPRAILWVPAGQSPLAFQDWWEAFSLQLEETQQDAASLLIAMVRRPQLLLWSERITSVPRTWFERLVDHPANVAVRKLPFSTAMKEELLQSDEDLAWVRTRLGHLAEAQWAMLCPSSEAITDWLETDRVDPVLEARFKRVALARAAMERQLRMLEDAELISPQRAAAKRQAGGLVERAGPVTWLRSSLLWHGARLKSLGYIAASVAARLTQGAILMPSFHAVRGQEAVTDDTPVAFDTLVAELENGEAVDFTVEDKWVHFVIQDHHLLIRIGENSIKRFKEFQLEFRRGQDKVLTVISDRGMARLTPEHLKQLQDGRARQLVIFL